MRLGPIPFSATNYFCGLLHDIHAFKYWLISVSVNEPFVAVSVAFGKSLKGLADLLRGEHLSASELSVLIVGFVSSIVLAAAGVVYFRRALRQLEADEALSAGEHAPPAQLHGAASSCTRLEVDLASTGRHVDVDHA